MSETTEKKHSWNQMPGEPDEWYEKFVKYYLELGPGRTLLRAYVAFKKDTNPSYRAPNSAPVNWTMAAGDWEWRMRSQDYDTYNYEGLVGDVQSARNVLLISAVEAAETLRGALKDPRLKVAAAKEILDRSGVPAVSVHDIRSTPFTADELAKAHEELKEWERQTKPKSDENG
jgi:hypothetical protein